MMGKKKSKVFGPSKSPGGPQRSLEEIKGFLKKMGLGEKPDEEGRFRITCRSCGGKGRIDLVFGGPPQNPCNACKGWGYQYVDKLTADEWRKKRNFITEIPGLCRDCVSYNSETGVCAVIIDEIIEGNVTRVINNRDGSRSHLHDFDWKRRPNDSCTEFTLRG